MLLMNVAQQGTIYTNKNQENVYRNKFYDYISPLDTYKHVPYICVLIYINVCYHGHHYQITYKQPIHGYTGYRGLEN